MNNYKVNMLKPLIRLNESIINLKRSAGLNPRLNQICSKYETRLNEGFACEDLCDEFCDDISSIGLSCCNKEIQSIHQQEDSEKHNISILREFSRLAKTDKMLHDAIEPKLVTYLTSKTEESLQNLMEIVSALGMTNTAMANFVESLRIDDYASKILGKKSVMTLRDEYCEAAEPLYTKDDVINFAKKAVAESKKAEEAKNVPVTRLDARDYLRLPYTIGALIRKEPKNGELRSFCESYMQAMRQGKPQEALYESFINGLSQWNYLNAVDTEMSALKDRVEKYKQEIDLRYFLNLMNESTSYYIVPLIEECVVNYINNKNATTRSMLIHNLNGFMHDPFVKDMMNIVCNDMSLDTLMVNPNLEMNTAGTKTMSVHSPVKYIKENESIFNVDGTYYTRKGNTIAKLGKADIANLNESFKHTCNVLNSDMVQVDSVNDCIRVYGDKDTAVINDFGVTINGEKVNESELKNPIYVGYGAQTNGYAFYDAINTILESYDTIANLDFVKRVVSEHHNKSVDVFKVKGCLSISLNEDGMSTFYRNVNPVQCKNYMNEHMNVNVSHLFEGVLPNEKKVNEEIEETNKAFECYIKSLKEKKEQLEHVMEDVSEEDAKSVKDGIDMISKELDDTIDQYKKYKEKADDYLGKTKDSDKKSEPDSDILSVSNDNEDELSQPITEPSSEIPMDSELPSNDTPVDDDAFVMPDYDFGDEEKELTMDDINPEQVSSYDSVLDVPTSDAGYKIVSVNFNRNIKSNTTSKNGIVYVLIPTVNSNGDVKDEIKAVSFTLGENKNPILNNDESMPMNLYNAIVSEISKSPEIENVDMESDADTTPAEQPSTTSGEEIANSETSADNSLEMSDSEISSPIEQDSEFATEPTSIDSLNAENGETLPAEEPASEEVPAETQQTNDEVKEDVETPILVNDNDTGKNETFDGDIEKDGDIEYDPEYGDRKTTSVPNFNDGNNVHIVEFPVRIPFNLEEMQKSKYLQNFQMDAFKSYLDDANIENVETPQGIEVTLGNKMQIVYMKEFFLKKCRIYDEIFYRWFPELEKLCESAKQDIYTNPIYESLARGNAQTFEFPVDNTLMESLGEKGFACRMNSANTFNVRVSNPMEYNDLTNVLSEHYDNSISFKPGMENAIRTAMNEGKVIEFNYSAKLISELDKNGTDYSINESNEVNVPVLTANDAVNVFNISNKLGLHAINESVLENMLLEGNSEALKGVKVIVRDMNTGKEVEIDMSKLANEEQKEDKDTSEEDADGCAGFDDNTELFNNPEEAQAAQQEKENTQEAAAPKKKVFKFVPKSNSSSVKESVDEIKANAELLNEGVAAPGMMDKVILSDKSIGQIYGRTFDGDFLVLVQGSTKICAESSVKPMYPREDSLECNFKYDPKTLKGIYEQSIPCRVNDNMISEKAYCKCGDYMNGKKTGVVNVFTQSGNTYEVSMNDVTLMEDINNYNNHKDYAIGSYKKDNYDSNVYGVYYNTKDYEGNTGYVRCLKLNKNGETTMMTLPSYSITPEVK